jgi:hypothetical protein
MQAPLLVLLSVALVQVPLWRPHIQPRAAYLRDTRVPYTLPVPGNTIW